MEDTTLGVIYKRKKIERMEEGFVLVLGRGNMSKGEGKGRFFILGRKGRFGRVYFCFYFVIFE